MRQRLPRLCLRDLVGDPAPLSASKIAMATTPAIQMELRQLGNSDLHITSIGLGAWAIGGGDWEFAWGSQEDASSMEAIQHALELGINWIDTAAIYGLGHSEEVVARALKGSSQKPFLFTKCSMKWNLEDRKIFRALDAVSVRQECEDSLRRLEVDTIDLYQIHWPNPEDKIEEAWETMAQLKEEGKVRYLGVSNFNVEQMERIAGIAPITSLQPPYSLLNQKVQPEILPYCEKNNIGVINYSPMVSGLLTGKMTAERLAGMPSDDWRKRSPNFNEPKLSRNLKLADLLTEIGNDHGVQTGVIAIAWTLHNSVITAAIVGARDGKQVEGTLPAATFRLNEAEYIRINEFVAQNIT